MPSHCWRWGIHFDLANKKDRVEELDKTMEEPGFWDNPEKSTAIVQESKHLKDVIERYEKLCAGYVDAYRDRRGGKRYGYGSGGAGKL